MAKRYKVDPCDNLGSVEGLKRDRTWCVVDRETGRTVSEHDSRAVARVEARTLNGGYTGCTCGDGYDDACIVHGGAS